MGGVPLPIARQHRLAFEERVASAGGDYNIGPDLFEEILTRTAIDERETTVAFERGDTERAALYSDWAQKDWALITRLFRMHWESSNGEHRNYGF